METAMKPVQNAPTKIRPTEPPPSLRGSDQIHNFVKNGELPGTRTQDHRLKRADENRFFFAVLS